MARGGSDGGSSRPPGGGRLRGVGGKRISRRAGAARGVLAARPTRPAGPTVSASGRTSDATTLAAIAPPIIVKLGGSLGAGDDLKRWARIVARATWPVVVVPGGGAFADAVRAAQARHRFADAAAHRMAILAMHQTALMLLAMAPRFVAAESVAEMRAAWAQGRVPVWLPLRMTDRDARIPANWTITSDGLAARLAERLGATAVCLVKSRCCERSASAEQLAADGVVDRQFAIIVARGDLVWRVLGPGEERQLARALRVPSAKPQLRPRTKR